MITLKNICNYGAGKNVKTLNFSMCSSDSKYFKKLAKKESVNMFFIYFSCSLFIFLVLYLFFLFFIYFSCSLKECLSDLFKSKKEKLEIMLAFAIDRQLHEIAKILIDKKVNPLAINDGQSIGTSKSTPSITA